MLRREPKADFEYIDKGFLIKRRYWYLVIGNKVEPFEWTNDAYEQLYALQHHTPQLILGDTFTERQLWWFNDEFYWEDEGYTELQVKALILEKSSQKEKKL